MTSVQTVRGPIDSSDPGKTLVHDAVQKLNELKSLGIDTMLVRNPRRHLEGA